MEEQNTAIEGERQLTAATETTRAQSEKDLKDGGISIFRFSFRNIKKNEHSGCFHNKEKQKKRNWSE